MIQIDPQVYVYNVEFGRQLGAIEAHDDTVSALLVSQTRLVTASWDGMVKLWT